MKTRLEEVKELVEADKAKILCDLLKKRYFETKENAEDWRIKLDSDLESYARRRIELAFLEKGIL